MAGLLVSVRSADEARAAVDGGATIVDVKEPDNGPLGRTPAETWRAVRAVVPDSIPISVALGELRDWDGGPDPSAFEGISYAKFGLAGCGAVPGWVDAWNEARRSTLAPSRSVTVATPGGIRSIFVASGFPQWVAVVYADWKAADAPDPDAVLDASGWHQACPIVLVDTWDKSARSPLGPVEPWLGWAERVRRSHRSLALAGGLDRNAILRLAPLRPEIYAVRGAACDRSDRRGTVRRERVAMLARAVRESLCPPIDLP